MPLVIRKRKQPKRRGGYAQLNGPVNFDDITRKAWPVQIPLPPVRQLSLAGNAYSETSNRLNTLSADGHKINIIPRKPMKPRLPPRIPTMTLRTNAYSSTDNRINEMIADRCNPSKTLPTLGGGQRHIGMGHQQVAIRPKPCNKQLLLKRAILMES